MATGGTKANRVLLYMFTRVFVGLHCSLDSSDGLTLVITRVLSLVLLSASQAYGHDQRAFVEQLALRLGPKNPAAARAAQHALLALVE